MTPRKTLKQTDAYVEHLFEGPIEKRICPQTKGTFMPLPSICGGKGQASERSDRWWSYQGRRGAMKGFMGGPESLLFGQIVSCSLPGSWHFCTRRWETWRGRALWCMHKCRGLENGIQETLEKLWVHHCLLVSEGAKKHWHSPCSRIKSPRGGAGPGQTNESTPNPNPWDTQPQTHFSKLKHTELSPLPGLWVRVHPGTRNCIRSDSIPGTFGSTLPTYKTLHQIWLHPLEFWLDSTQLQETASGLTPPPGLLLHQFWLISGTINPYFQIFS